MPNKKIKKKSSNKKEDQAVAAYQEETRDLLKKKKERLIKEGVDPNASPNFKVDRKKFVDKNAKKIQNWDGKMRELNAQRLTMGIQTAILDRMRKPRPKTVKKPKKKFKVDPVVEVDFKNPYKYS